MYNIKRAVGSASRHRIAHRHRAEPPPLLVRLRRPVLRHTPNLPTTIIPAKTTCIKLYGSFPMDMRIPPLKSKIMLEANPLKSRILVQRLAVTRIRSTREIPDPMLGPVCRVASRRRAARKSSHL